MAGQRRGRCAPTGHRRVGELARRALAESIGTALLVAAVVGSGIQAQRLSPHDVGLQLLENSLATAGALASIILAVGPASGAHLNPVISLADRCLGGLSTAAVAVYVPAQVAGAAAGAATANVMFGLPPLQLSTRVRGGGGLWFAEAVATFGLVLLVFALARAGRAGLAAVAVAVAVYIAGAYWFTSSTSFANPAVTLGRVLSDTFAGIAPGSAPAFVAAQLVGGAAGLLAVRALYPVAPAAAGRVLIPHEQAGL